MLKIAYLLGLLLIVLPSCKNTLGTAETEAELIASTDYLKSRTFPIDSVLLRLQPEEIQQAYKSNGYKTLWDEKQDRDALYTAILDAEYDGLNPEDYSFKEMEAFERRDEISEAECVKHDLMLTKTFLQFSNHLFKGKIDPETVYRDWDLEPKILDANKLLFEALTNHTVTEVLDRCRPPHQIYASLRNSLKYLRKLPDDTMLSYIFVNKPLKLNDVDSTAIPKVKQRLAYWKDLPETATSGPVYDEAMLLAVKKFQERHGLALTGKLDSATVAELNVPKTLREEQIIVNLERWRWFPYTLGENAVVVNIPDFMLAVVENSKDTIQKHKVVVGKPERKTPVIVSKFNSVVVNPTWTVPPTIIREDLTPAAMENPDYFSKMNMTIYDSKGRQVSPYNWNFEKANSYRYVQGPGLKNSLGQIKFNFNNKRRVYLHDTNHRELFNAPYRAFSSGCVRVHEPIKLAAYMLDTPKRGLDEKKINEILAKGGTATISLKKTIHVHQLYWTAWMDKNGLQFRHDIYYLDRQLYDKLRHQPASLAVSP